MVRGLLARRFASRRANAVASDAPAGDAAGTSRRTLITRGLWAIGGAGAAGVAGVNLFGTRQSATPMATTMTPALAHVSGPTTISVTVRDIRFAAQNLKPGMLPDGPSLASPHGKLSGSDGSIVGAFSGGVLPGSGGLIAFQRFTFSDGTIIGMGSGSLDGEEYAVVGGTGRFSGASGSYLTRLAPGVSGRDADFLINITGTRE